jgi:hypothetical protein
MSNKGDDLIGAKVVEGRSRQRSPRAATSPIGAEVRWRAAGLAVAVAGDRAGRVRGRAKCLEMAGGMKTRHCHFRRMYLTKGGVDRCDYMVFRKVEPAPGPGERWVG